MAEQSNQPGIKDLYKVLSDIEQRHDAEVKRLQEECSKYLEKLKQKDIGIGRLQEECSKYEENLKQKDIGIGRLKGTCSQNKLQLDEKDNTIKRLQEVCSKYEEKLKQKDLAIGRLQEVCSKYEEKLKQKDLAIGRAIDEQTRLRDELEARTTQIERLKDVEALARALEKTNFILSEKTRELKNTVDEKKAREKTIKEDAKQKLERTETDWKKKLQGKEDELKRTETRWKKKLQGKEDELKSLRENYKTEKTELLNNWKLYFERLQTELNKKDDALKQIQRELDLKDGALKGLSALMSTKLTTNNPEKTDLSDINRPTKLAEQWGELYDNEYTELFEALQCVDEKKISLILKLLKRSFEICQEIREQGVVCLSYFSENNTMHNPLFKMEEEGDKEPRCNEEPADHEDPESASSKGDKNEGTKDPRSNEEPGGNVGPDSASSLRDKNKGGESQVNPDPKHGIDDTADDIQNDQVYGRRPSFSQQQSAVKIDDNQKQTIDKCSQTATTEMVKLDVPDELKRELMLELSPYLKKKAFEIVDILNKELPERVAKEFDMPWKTGNALDFYLKSCIRLCWLMGIQSPPVYIRFDEHDQASRHVKLDKHFYREYTKASQYIDYVVWPPLQLYKEGPLLRRGVAQGADSKD